MQLETQFCSTDVSNDSIVFGILQGSEIDIGNPKNVFLSEKLLGVCVEK